MRGRPLQNTRNLPLNARLPGCTRLIFTITSILGGLESRLSSLKINLCLQVQYHQESICNVSTISTQRSMHDNKESSSEYSSQKSLSPQVFISFLSDNISPSVLKFFLYFCCPPLHSLGILELLPHYTGRGGNLLSMERVVQ